MRLQIECLVVFAMFLSSSTGNLLPLPMPKCVSSDKECLCAAATLGIILLKTPNKALGLPSIDPYVIERIHVKPNTNSRVSFAQDYFHMEFRKISEGKVTDFNVTMNATHCTIIFDLYMDNFEMISWYRWKGNVMGYPIDGSGRNNITSIDVIHTHKLLFTIDKKQENKMNLRAYDVDLKPKKLIFDVENLVRDDADASARASKLFNDYSTPIFNAVKNDYDRTFTKCFQPYICAFFKDVRLGDLFLDAPPIISQS